MIAQTHTEKETTSQETAAPRRTAKPHGALEFTALCCLSAGAVAILRAVEMERAGDGLLCLLSSLAACGLVCYLYFRRD